MLKTLENWTDNKEPIFLRMRLAPNRSLDSYGTKIVFLVIACGFLLPIIPFIGSPIGTTLTIFSGLTFYLFLIMLQRNFQQGNTFEEIFISKSKIVVVHQEKNKKQKTWEGNPYWTRVTLDINNPKLKNYLTLAGKGRHIELGAFLSPDERIQLRDKIQNALAKAKSA
jgi:uncharacterized membrane protein